MARVALLMGVSRYAPGLDPLPEAQRDLVIMQRVLHQCQFEVIKLCDHSQQDMQETIERFFKQRDQADQVVFLFCGYILQDTDGRLYFATLNTTLESEGAIVKAQTIPASVVQEAMNGSPAKQQIVILDSHLRSVSNQAMTAGDSPFSSQLGGTGRAILTATDTQRQFVTPTELDVLTYTGYLAEGIKSGAADTNDDGAISAEDAHRYAAKKLQIAAPALKPQLYGSTETAQIPLFEVAVHDPQVIYRKMLEEAPATNAMALNGEPMLGGQSVLDKTRHQFGLSPHDADALQLQVLRPQRDYQQRVTFYQEQMAALGRSQDATSPETSAALKRLQQALCLIDDNVVMLAIVPFLAGRQTKEAQYQKNRMQYQQVLLQAMQRQYPLQEGDRALLQRLQRSLHLKDDDVQNIEAEINNQAKQFKTSPTDEPVAPRPTDHPVAPRPEEPLPTPAPAPARPTPTPQLSDTQRAIIDVWMNPGATNQMPSPNPTPAPTPTPTVSSPVAPLREESRPLPQTADSNPTVMDRFRRSASNYQALIIPAVLLAAIFGLLAAVLSSSNPPNWIPFWQKHVDRRAAQQFNTSGLRKAQQGYNKEAIDDYNKAIEQNPNDATLFINRGMAHHKLGDTGAAIGDYEQAIKLTPNAAPAHSNLSYAYYDRQNYDKALEEGNKAVVLDGRMPQAHINLANARSKKGDYDGAIRDYNQAIALSPPAAVLAGAYNNRGNAQFALGKTREATTDYNQAIRLQPSYADAYYNLGLAEQVLGDRVAAVRYLQTAANLFSSQGNPRQQKEAADRATAIQQGQTQTASPLSAT